MQRSFIKRSMSKLRIIAILAVYNEELFLPICIKHLLTQGIEVYIVDNNSTDQSYKIASSFLGNGVIFVEHYPRHGSYEWLELLKRKEQISQELGPGWYMHQDADEIRQSPNFCQTLAETIEAADLAGYNAINFDEFVFVPTLQEENYENSDYVKEMRYYYFFEPQKLRQVKLWKNFGQKINLHDSGGHLIEFDGRKIYPQNFIMRHYMALSHTHIIRKYCGKIYSEIERKKGWHNERAVLRPEQIKFPDRSRLCRISSANNWDRSVPWTKHAIFEDVQTSSQQTGVLAKKCTGFSPPSPFIVGSPRSGTTLLRLMLDSHSDLAIPPETHFIPQLVQEWPLSNQKEFFLKTLTEHRSWGDFHMDPTVLESKIFAISLFDLTLGLRAFYQLYAERFGKKRWGDKTPLYVTSMELIQKLLPEARFIHLVRDGRDVAVSLRNLWFGPKSLEEKASRWVWTIKEARRQAQNMKHYLEVRYEDLILDTVNTLKRICGFIDFPWNPGMLNYHERAGERLTELNRDVIDPGGERMVLGNERLAIHRMTIHSPEAGRIGRWKTELNDLEKKVFMSIAKPMLAELGYEVD